MSNGRRLVLVDTSVAVALLVADHDQHDAVHEAVGSERIGLSGHAAFETFSVLTRLPAPARRPVPTVMRLLTTNFPLTRYLPASAASELFRRLEKLGLAGGAVYDALVAAAARHHTATLLTLDRRALSTYRAMDVDFRVVG